MEYQLLKGQSVLLTARRRRAVLAGGSVFLNRGKRFLALLAVYF